jgi:hypothetical protein
VKTTKLTVLLGAAALTALATVANAQTKSLDRAALLKLADDYFAALLAHDARKVPHASEL